MASRSSEYDIEQIMFSFERYRSEHFFDKDSFRQQFEKHFNPALAEKMADKVWKQETVQKSLERNRKALEERGKLPAWQYSNAELKEVHKIPYEWRVTTIRGRHVRAHEVTIVRKGKSVQRWRDTYGRFTSSPSSQ